MHFRFYREHKYISYMLYELEQVIAKTDFNSTKQITQLAEQLNTITELLKDHAEYEESAIHELLRVKNRHLHEVIELDHQEHEKELINLREILLNLNEILSPEEKLNKGYDFYLSYRYFVSEILRHLHQEETVILPELQKLYAEQDLRQVEFATYGHMTAEQMIDMMQVLFPHMNIHDKQAFLTDIKDSEPEKFVIA